MTVHRPAAHPDLKHEPVHHEGSCHL
jgi:hypothetical protein